MFTSAHCLVPHPSIDTPPHHQRSASTRTCPTNTSCMLNCATIHRTVYLSLGTSGLKSFVETPICFPSIPEVPARPGQLCFQCIIGCSNISSARRQLFIASCHATAVNTEPEMNDICGIGSSTFVERYDRFQCERGNLNPHVFG